MIHLQRLTKKYPGGVLALDGIDLHVHRGELFVFLGPGGCGKTTALRCINRLVEPTDGHVFVDGKNVKEIDDVLLRRNIGYVVQEVGLFPHLTIAENVELVPKLKGWPVSVRNERVDELLALIGLNPAEYRHQKPKALSAGHQRRVGIARALAADPDILLMDDPFGGLDLTTRNRLQRDLKRIARQLRKTIVFVTDDVNEALFLGDRIGLMERGKIVQVGTPEALLFKPADPFVSEFIGENARAERLLHIRVRDIAGEVPYGLAGLNGRSGIPRLDENAKLLDLVPKLEALILSESIDGFLAVNRDGQATGYVGYRELVRLLVEVYGRETSARSQAQAMAKEA